ncbi:MAG: CdaR family protein [Clostridia bacterium]|nr:CdaR family protein [Clostridia bacterium]
MMNSRPTKKPDAQRGPFKGLRSFIARIFASKAFLGVLSLMVAVLTWSVLVASDGTLTRQRTFSSVAVSVTGESSLKSRGYIVMDDITELVPSVKMTVEVSQQNYSRVSGTAYNPHFDLSQITGEGENELTIAYSSQLYGPVVSCEPSTVTVNVERYITRRVPVVLELVGEAPDGVYLDAYRTDPTMLSVSGPQSLVSSVARASAKLDLAALSADRMTDRMSLDIELQDASGAVIESDKLEVTNQTVITESIVAETELVPAKYVPLELDTLITGTPAEGYELGEVTAEQTELLVAAKQEILDAIVYLTTDQPLSIEGATGNVTGYVKLKRPSGIENTLPSEVAVTAVIQEQSIERTFRSVSVEIDGLSDELKATLSRDRMTVQLTGGYSFIKGLTTDDLRLYVDVSDLGEGTHVVPVQIRIDNAQEFACALSAPEISVTLKAK